MGGEILVRRMTNAIRPGGVASLLAKGEAQPPMLEVGKWPPLRGSVRKRAAGSTWGGWRRNGINGRAREAGRPVAHEWGVHAGCPPKSPGHRSQSGHRSTKRRNGRGAKGRREVTA